MSNLCSISTSFMIIVANIKTIIMLDSYVVSVTFVNFVMVVVSDIYYIE